MRVNITSDMLSIAQQAKIQFPDETLYYNYRELANLNDNTFLETIHTNSGKLSAATVVFEDGSELIITKEIVAVVSPRRR